MNPALDPLRNEYERPWGTLAVVQQYYYANADISRRPFPDTVPVVNIGKVAVDQPVALSSDVVWAKSKCRPLNVEVELRGADELKVRTSTLFAREQWSEQGLKWGRSPGVEVNTPGLKLWLGLSDFVAADNPQLTEQLQSTMVHFTYANAYESLLKSDEVVRHNCKRLKDRRRLARLGSLILDGGILGLVWAEVPFEQTAAWWIAAGVGGAIGLVTERFIQRSYVEPHKDAELRLRGTREEIERAASILASRAALDVAHLLQANPSNPYN
ncbi:MAG TPA: hypothetical protein VLI54_00290 [Bacillota bacterium]|nr:hypothetical protein [Bacillota bacterium]